MNSLRPQSHRGHVRINTDLDYLHYLEEQIGRFSRRREEMSGIRFKNNFINGMVIEDAYIYRLL